MLTEVTAESLVSYLSAHNRVLSSGVLDWKTARVCEMIRGFCVELSEIFKRQLGAEFCLQQSAEAEEFMPFQQQGYASVHFRVFQSNALLLLPFELVSRFSSFVLGEKLGREGLEPGNDEVTAFSFALARVLAEEELFSQQKISLAGMNLHGLGVEDSFLEDLERDLESGESVSLSFELCCAEELYPLTVCFDKKLLKRILYCSRLHFEQSAAPSFLSSLSSRWTLQLHLPLESFLQLIQMRPGDVWPVFSEGGSEDSRYPSQVFESYCSLGQVVEGGGGTELKASLLGESRPGVFRLQLADKVSTKPKE